MQEFHDEHITRKGGAFVQIGCLSDEYSKSEINAVVANIDRRTRDELADLFLVLSAKGANQIA